MVKPMSSPPETIPSSLDFATEVKADRLSLLWKTTIFGSVMVLILAVFAGAVDNISFPLLVLAPIVLIIFSLLTQYLLRKELFEYAAFAFIGGGLVAGAAILLDTAPLIIQAQPFMFVLVVFIAGLLVHPQTTFVVAFLASGITIGMPYLTTGSMDFYSAYQTVAILLMFISALLAAQVTGELYAVTEWALMNYQRERRTNLDLFESRMELQRTLKRSEALGEQLKEANVELESAHHAAEAAKNFRGQFLANMSHELRTPLNAIIGFSETMLKFPMMYDNEPLADKYREDLNQIFTSGQQLLHVINDILDLAKVDAGKLEVHLNRTELRPILDSVVATASGLVSKKSIELKTELPDTLPDIAADETRVRQVLLNLYSNAAKFTDEGSITLTVKPQGDEVLFSVADTGIGIEPAQQEIIFEEFRQTSNTGGRDPRAGAGLGLAIARQLLELMNGRIWVESVPGEGSTFYFTLNKYIDTEESEKDTQEPISAIVDVTSDDATDDVVMEAVAAPRHDTPGGAEQAQEE